MATTRTPRDAWVKQGLRALAKGGPDAVRIEVLARELGVTKGGFYWHFDDRQALLQEVLDAWEHWVIDDAIEHIEAKGGDPRARLRELFSIAGSAGSRTDLSVRDWARKDRAVARRLKRIDSRRMDYLRSLFSGICDDAEEVEARSLLTMALFIANPFLDVSHGERTRGDVMRAAQAYLLS